ncbi:Uncharacterised protein [Vibrio cholerae]|nr:Uncharacterised protein [Vibrio cholerae]
MNANADCATKAPIPMPTNTTRPICRPIIAPNEWRVP